MFGLIGCRNFRMACEHALFSSWPKKNVSSVLSENGRSLIRQADRLRGTKGGAGTSYEKSERFMTDSPFAARSDSDVLYARLSSRLMTALSPFVLDVDVCAPDSAFLSLSGFDRTDLKGCGDRIVRKAQQETGLPLYLGIGATRTLARIASLFAERYPGYRGVCVIDTQEKREKALRLTPLAAVLGGDEAIIRKLSSKGVETTYDFSILPQEWVRKHMDKAVFDLWNELNGRLSSLKTGLLSEGHISTCRSFQQPVEARNELENATAACLSDCGRRLRAENRAVVSLLVFTGTERSAGDLSQTYETRIVSFPQATADLSCLRRAVMEAISSLYRQGNRYIKTGVVLVESVVQPFAQITMFAMLDTGKEGTSIDRKAIDKSTPAQDVLALRAPKRAGKKKNDHFRRREKEEQPSVHC